MDKIFYKLIAGETFEIAKEIIEHNKATFKAWTEYGKALDAEDFLQSHGALRGLSFPRTPAPKGWTKADRNGMQRPKRRCKDLKEFNELPRMWLGLDASNKLGATAHMEGLTIYFTVPKQVGDDIYIITPLPEEVDNLFVPKGEFVDVTALEFRRIENDAKKEKAVA